MEQLGILALALAVRLLFAFGDGHGSSITFACDASEYLRDARGLSEVLNNPQALSDGLKLLLAGSTSTDASVNAIQIRDAFAPVKELAIAGPIFPLFLLSSFALFGLDVLPVNWQAPVLLQCLITSITCVFIARIAGAAWNRSAGTAAGIIAALYPAFIVNSVRMYSESFSCFCLCAVVALAIPVLYGKGRFHAVSAGLALAFLQVTRSVMVLVTAATFAVTTFLSPGRSRWYRLLGLVTGLALVFVPWMVFQQMAFGKSSLVVDRVGHYNLFIGTNVSTQGWLSYPYPDGWGIEKKSYFKIVGTQIKESPERFIKLMCDKPLRLFKFPWNDFRTPIGPLPMSWQVVLHQLVLALAAVGLTLQLFVGPAREPDRASMRMRYALLSIIGMHMVYLAFITVPRYNLTCMPFIIMFAGAGVTALLELARRSKATASQIISGQTTEWAIVTSLFVAMFACRFDWIGSVFLPIGSNAPLSLLLTSILKAGALGMFFACVYKAIAYKKGNLVYARYTLLGLALLVIPLCSFAWRAHGRWYEWSKPIVGSVGTLSQIEASGFRQVIVVPENRIADLQARDCYLLIDCDNWQVVGNGARILVNGIELKNPVMPIMPYSQNLGESKTRDRKGKVKEHYLECEDIYHSLTAASGGGNLDIRQWFAVAIPDDLIDSRLNAGHNDIEVQITGGLNPAIRGGIYGAYCDLKDEVRIPSVSKFSWEKAFYGVENEGGLSDSRYDEKVKTVPSHIHNNAHTSFPNIRLLVAPHAPSGNTPSIGLAGKTRVANRVALTAAEIPSYNADDMWTIDIGARICNPTRAALSVPLEVSANFQSLDELGVVHRYKSPWVPTSMIAGPKGGHFHLALPFKPSMMPGKLTEISLSMNDGGVADGRDLMGVHNPSKFSLLPASTIGDDNVDTISLEILPLRTSPIAPGFEVF